MRYRAAVAAMVAEHGMDRLYWSNGMAIEGEELLRAARETEDQLGDCDVLFDSRYIYCAGVRGKQPGVYRRDADGNAEGEPIVEVLR